MPSKILPTPCPHVGRFRIRLMAAQRVHALHSLGEACILLLLKVSLCQHLGLVLLEQLWLRRVLLSALILLGEIERYLKGLIV